MRRDHTGDWNMKLSALAAVAAAAGLAPAAHAQAAAIEWRPHVHKLRSRESVEAHLVKLEQDGRVRRVVRPDAAGDRAPSADAWHIIEA